MPWLLTDPLLRLQVGIPFDDFAADKPRSIKVQMVVITVQQFVATDHRAVH